MSFIDTIFFPFLLIIFYIHLTSNKYKKKTLNKCIMINNFYEQYNFAKETLLEAIKKENNVILFGTGPNGKSYLMNEMKDVLEENGYFYLNNTASDWCPDYWEKILKKNKAKKWIVETNYLGQLSTTFRESVYILINMDRFCHPKYTYLRSGLVSYDD